MSVNTGYFIMYLAVVAIAIWLGLFLYLRDKTPKSLNFIPIGALIAMAFVYMNFIMGMRLG